MPNRKRILIFPFDLLSHYLRCIVLAKKDYNQDQYEILFASSTSYHSFVTENGFSTFECERFDSQKIMELSRRFDFSWLNEKDLERILLSQVSAIQDYSPDIVIGDTAPTLKMAAEITGVEFHSLMNGYMTKYYSFQRELSRTHKAYPVLRFFPGFLSRKITGIAERSSLKKVHSPFRKLREKYQLSQVQDYISELVGDQNIICDHPEIFPQTNLPENYSFTGPLIYPAPAEGNWMKNLNTSRPVIFISMGSSGDWKKLSFLNDSYFARYTLITSGDAESILSADHIIHRDFVNMEEVLAKSDLMICHGGNGTLYAGLKSGVYMLCVTSHFEQEWNVHALERTGYGKSANHFSISKWKSEIEKSFERKYPALG